MQPLLRTYLDIALWRKGPQDLPASSALCVLVGLMYLVVGFLQVRVMNFPIADGLAFVTVGFGMEFLWVAFLLTFFSRSQRLLQTLSAVFGVGILLGVVDLAVKSVLLLGGLQHLAVEWLLLQLLALTLIVGRILMLAIDRGMVTGAALVIAMVLSSNAVANLVLRHM